MKISVIHPSRGRSEQAHKTIVTWLIKCHQASYVEYILSVDASDKQGLEYQKIADKTGIKLLVRYNETAIQAINEAAKICTGDLIIVISDDFDCIENWDLALMQAIEYTEDQQYIGRKDYCIKTDDGLQPTLITMPILDRVYYERYGYIYFEGYRHLFCDQELTAVAMMTGKYIKLPLKFEHLHYSTGKSPKDEINVRNDLTWRQGEILFNERLKTNFGIENPVMAYTDIKWR